MRPLPLIAAVAALVLVGAATSYSVIVDRWDAERIPPAPAVAEANQALLNAIGTITDGAADARVALRTYPHWYMQSRVGLGDTQILPGRQFDTWTAQRLTHFAQSFPVDYRQLADADLAQLHTQNVTELPAVDGFVVRIAELQVSGREVVAWDGIDAIRDADVSQRDRDGEISQCTTWTREAWHCGSYHAYIHVGPSLQQMGDQDPHRCISANAAERGAVWQIDWTIPAAIASGARTLRFQAGNTFEAVRGGRGTPLDFRVFVNEQPVFERRFDVLDTAYIAHSVPLPEDADANLRFEVRADDHLDRLFCFLPQVVTSTPTDSLAPALRMRDAEGSAE